MAPPIKDLSISQVESFIRDLGIPKFRSSQILSWLYAKNVSSFDEMTNLPKTMREQLSEVLPLFSPEIVDKQVSRDGSRKYLLRFHDGIVAETVGMPSQDGRLSVCVSSQSGCSMECAFCATGRLGLARNLMPGEIIDQVSVVQADFGQRVSNIVVMGQGEPFQNYDNTMAALQIANDSKLLNIGARHITISTCGLLSGIRKLAQEPEQYTLAVSLHSAQQDVRNKLMPRMSNQPLNDLRRELDRYTDRTSRRFSVEYALMKGVNDSPEAFDALVSFCKGMLCHVNLIPLNEVEDSPFKPVGRSTLTQWQSKLENNGIAATVRNSRGSDIAGACGQLAAANR